MSQLTPIEIAYQFLSESKNPLSFNEIWEHVLTIAPLPENVAKQKKVRLYNAMMLDARFSSLKDNFWDLAQRVKFEDKHIDIDELVIDDDEEEEELEETEMVDEEVKDDDREYEPEESDDYDLD